MTAIIQPSAATDDDYGHGPAGQPRWYVARTKPHGEQRAASALAARQLSVYLPLLRRRARHEPLFPGYLFLRMDLATDDYLRGRSAPGVSYILGAERVPLAVPDDLVDSIAQRVARENALKPAERFAPGDRVVIMSGPFRDVEAIFDRSLTARGRCLVFLQILGRLTRVEVDAEQLDRLEAASR